MKKKLIVLLIMCLFILSLVGCGKSYQESANINENFTNKEHFTIVERHRGTSGTIGNYLIIYANDTKVMYIFSSVGITPLYNTDGTLQIYDGE